MAGSMTTMNTAGGRRIRLTDTLREATAALTLLDAEALERLSRRLTAIVGGVATGATGLEQVVEREPVEAILARQRVLASVLAATSANLQVLERMAGLEGGDRGEWSGAA